MTKSKIAVSMIVKDDSELPILKRALASLGKDNVDAVFITGTKDPQHKLKKFCKKYEINYSFFPWCNDFSAARNFNLEQIPREYEWVFWFDTDDVVQGAETFRSAVELAETNNIKAVFARYLYQVELDEKGNVKNILIEHLRERLIRNDGTFKWVAPIHETLIEQVPAGKTDFQGFLVVHLVTDQDMERSMWRNIEILEEDVVNHSEDPRPIYYLAKAYYDTRIPEIVYEPIGPGLGSLTMELLKIYINTSGWAEERAQAWEYLAMLNRERGEHKKAIQCLLEALYEDPKFTSIYVQLALCYVMTKEWDRAMHWVKLASQVPIPKTTLVIQPRDYKTMILEALFHIYLNTGKLDECLRVAQGMVEMLPSKVSEDRVQNILDLKHKNDMAHWIVKLASSLKETGQTEQLTKLVGAIPEEIANEPVMVNLRNEYSLPRVWGEDEIAIYCGPGWEKWSPRNVNQGIGGSEEAVIYLSYELAKLGWKVTVFADPREEMGVYDKVNYVPYYHFNIKDKFNILVSWRQIGFFDLPDLKCNKAYLWNHDIQEPLTYIPERVNKIDKVMFLSKWHRDNVPELPEDKVMITSNGI